jgi:hypothetical protein
MFSITETYDFNGIRLKYKRSTECYAFFDCFKFAAGDTTLRVDLKPRKFKIGSSNYKLIKVFKPSQEDQIKKLEEELRQLRIHKLQVADFEAINSYINDNDVSLASVLHRNNISNKNKYFDSFYKKRFARNYIAHPRVKSIKTDKEFLEAILKIPK